MTEEKEAHIRIFRIVQFNLNRGEAALRESCDKREKTRQEI